MRANQGYWCEKVEQVSTLTISSWTSFERLRLELIPNRRMRRAYGYGSVKLRQILVSHFVGLGIRFANIRVDDWED